ncbi:hypothetical protein PTKIN_Ptkin06aG0041300 [Pterospermum kingtungense]
MFRPFLQTIRKGFHVSSTSRVPALVNDVVVFDEQINVATPIPDDVGEGYFTVLAVLGKETQRFVIELDNLTNPAFLSLLELAQEEYGFQQKGVLSLPCRPQELQNILDQRRADHAGIQGWTTCNIAATMQGYLL